MPTITLTNNTTLNIAASSADDNGTLNRYLKDPLKFVTPAGFDAIAGQKVADVDPAPFPLTATATGEGKFAVEKTTLDVKLNASASLGLLKADDQSDFLKSLQLPPGHCHRGRLLLRRHPGRRRRPHKLLSCRR